MKKRINLITKQKKYQDLERAFKKLRVASFIMVGVFVLVSLVVLAVLFLKKEEVDHQLSEKKALYDFVIQNKEEEAKFVYFRGKQNQIGTSLKGDVNFYPYYALLADSLSQSESSDSALLDSLTIKSDRKTRFTIAFKQFDTLVSRFKYFESDEFLNNFDQLSVVNFSPIEQAEAKEYRLNFEGKFKEIR